MYAAISSYLSQIPFFSSVGFGIMSMLIVGASWCLIGLIMGDAPKRGIEPSLVQLFGAVVSAAASIIIMVGTGAYPTAPAAVVFWTCAAYMYSGMSNFFMLQLMSSAMQTGPNGIIWAIIQSALVFPFIGGIVFFGVEFTIFRGIGIVLLLAALVLFAFVKDNSKNDGKWKMKAFICLAMCAVQQNITTMPSYFAETRGVPSICRALAVAVATLVSALIYNIVRMNDARREQIKNNIRNITLWKYIAGLQFFNLVFAYTLLYPGFDSMADHGLGGMCYPLLVGSCIISFTVTSVLVLKERVRAVQIAALAVCVAGLIFVCTKA